MPIIEPVQREAVDEKYHDLVFDGSPKHDQSRDVSSSTMVGMFGHSPEAFLRLTRWILYLRWKSAFEPRLRQMAILAVSRELRSRYTFIHHVRMGIEKFGCSEADVLFAAGQGEPRPGSIDALIVEASVLMARRQRVPVELGRKLADALGAEHFVDFLNNVGAYCHICTVLDVLRATEIEDYPGMAAYREKYEALVPLPEGE